MLWIAEERGIYIPGLVTTTMSFSTAYVDSNSEASDSDLSDIGEIDSDLEREKQVRYDRNLYKEDTKNFKKLMRSDMKPGEKRSSGPTDSLRLEFVHG